MMIRQRLLVATLALARLMPYSVAQRDDEFDNCMEAIRKSDINANNRMTKDPEYMLFLTEILGHELSLSTFADLPEPLKMNFEIYEFEGGINIHGATLEDADKRQIRVVETLCRTTYLALDAIPEDDSSRISALNGTAAIESSATSLPTTPPSSNSTSSSGAFSDPQMEADQSDPVANVTEAEPEPSLEPARDSPLNVSSAATASLNETIQTTDASETAANAQEPGTDTPTTPNSTVPSSVTQSLTDAPMGNVTRPASVTNEGTTESTTNTSTTTTFVSAAVTRNATVPPSASNETALPSIEATRVNTTIGDSSTESNGTTTVAESPTSPPTATGTTGTDLSSNQTIETEGNETSSPTAASTTKDPYSDCKMVMKFNDIDADGTMNKMEYVWFLNDNWDSPYPGVAFKNLPLGLKDNFFKFASEGGINISMTLSQEKMTSDQEQFMDQICNETEVALSEASSSGNAGEEATMAVFKECLIVATSFDADADAFFDEIDYVSLIQELSLSKFGKNSFHDLPEVLQNNFYSLAESTAIDLGGAKEGESLSSSQQEILEQICVDTSYALEEASKGTGEEGSPGFDAVDTETMLEYAVCFMQMADHDQNQDSRLDEVEYAALVNQLGKNHFHNMTFDDLPSILQDNFLNLQTNGTINVEGSQEDQIPDNTQQHFLGRVCIETTAAVNIEISFEDPSPESPQIADGVAMGEQITIHSSFSIYSDVLIPDHEFMMGPTRDMLEEAYKQFVVEVVDGFSGDSRTRRSLRRRRLEEAVDGDIEFLALLDRDSPTVYDVVDLNCAGASQDAMCKTVFAQYEITPIESMDREAMYEDYVRVTQSYIDAGLLQRILERVDPETMVAVIGASEPVVFDEEMVATPPPLSSMPFLNDDGYEEDMTNSKKKTIALIAVVVGAILLASLIGLIAVRLRKRKAAAAAASSGDAGSSTDPSMDKLSDQASDTASKDEFQQEGSSDFETSSRGSRIFRSRHNGVDSDDDVTDDDLEKMQVVELCEGMTAATNDFEAISNKHLRDLVHQGEGSYDSDLRSSDSFPPLRKKKDGSDSEDMSFAFRRYAIDGEKGKSQQQVECSISEDERDEYEEI